MKTIFTIFAGRKVYLEILFTYLDRLLERGLLTEVHLWDYTREKSDEEYIEKICQEKEHYKLMKLSRGVRLRIIRTRHYHLNLKPFFFL